ncbi:MAG: Jag N-terminal domain-containing protein [Chloroflexi bacterium]|nr:Jag N-terminal domain-containing protein [Chloroflexota bacterium]
MEMIEVTANSVQAAIDKGLAQLKARPGEVVVEVLEEPNTGLFGFGAREARVRLVLISRRREERQDEVDRDEEIADRKPSAQQAKIISDEELDEDARVGKQVLEELLAKMHMEARIDVKLSDDDDEGEQPHWMLNIAGDHVSRLIGRRGETLAALQHIVRLICSRRLERRANIIIDAGGYKSGRSKRLRGLAKRMAKQAVQQGRTITLEPMQPNERRIIHLALRGRNDVMTRSVGEGRARKVTIVPK